MNNTIIKKIDEQWLSFKKVTDKPFYFKCDDECYYFYEYYPKPECMDFATYNNRFPDSNFICNFKKPKGVSSNEKKYKISAINQFISDLTIFFQKKKKLLDNNEELVLIPAPRSKPRQIQGIQNSKFDAAIDYVVNCICRTNSLFKYQPVIDVKKEMQPSHLGGPRTPLDIEPYIKIIPFTTTIKPSTVYIVDDVVTSGAHFVAIKSALKKKYPDLKVVGLFWAKTTHEQTSLNNNASMDPFSYDYDNICNTPFQSNDKKNNEDENSWNNNYNEFENDFDINDIKDEQYYTDFKN